MIRLRRRALKSTTANKRTFQHFVSEIAAVRCMLQHHNPNQTRKSRSMSISFGSSLKNNDVAAACNILHVIVH